MKTDTVCTPGGRVQCPWREGAKVRTEAVRDKMQARRGTPSVLLDSKKAESECGRESKMQPVSGEGGERWASKLTAKKRQKVGG